MLEYVHEFGQWQLGESYVLLARKRPCNGDFGSFCPLCSAELQTVRKILQAGGGIKRFPEALLHLSLKTTNPEILC
jgi:hypothetical protein